MHINLPPPQKKDKISSFPPKIQEHLCLYALRRSRAVISIFVSCQRRSSSCSTPAPVSWKLTRPGPWPRGDTSTSWSKPCGSDKRHGAKPFPPWFFSKGKLLNHKSPWLPEVQNVWIFGFMMAVSVMILFEKHCILKKDTLGPIHLRSPMSATTFNGITLFGWNFGYNWIEILLIEISSRTTTWPNYHMIEPC